MQLLLKHNVVAGSSPSLSLISFLTSLCETYSSIALNRHINGIVRATLSGNRLNLSNVLLTCHQVYKQNEVCRTIPLHFGLQELFISLFFGISKTALIPIYFMYDGTAKVFLYNSLCICNMYSSAS